MTTLEYTEAATHNQAETSTAYNQPAPTQKPRLLDRKGVKTVVGLLVPLVLFVTWWALTAAEVFTAVQLPSPSAVFEASTLR